LGGKIKWIHVRAAQVPNFLENSGVLCSQNERHGFPDVEPVNPGMITSKLE
jgi:hypothetical protein